MRSLLHTLTRHRQRLLVIAAACVCAAGGVTVAIAETGSGGGDDPSLFTYDTLLGETVPIANDADLRAGFISPTAVEGTGTVAFDEGLPPPTDESANDLQMETAEPQPYGPVLERVSNDGDPSTRSALYPSSIIDATTAYSVYDGTTGTTVWAGGISSDSARGVFLKTVDSATDSGNPQTLDLSGTGPITLTRFDGDNLYFTTSNAGQFGVYHIAAGTADLFAVQSFGAPIDNPPTINRAVAGRAIPVKWRITDASGSGVSDPATFLSITSGSTTCSSTDPTSDIETYSGSSGLQYLGNGWWQFNWATPVAYATQCRTMRLNLADTSSGPTALFQFR
ncbi:MAG TPA: PxKF domain-containing protein [Gaiellaceae bacterium]